MILDSLSNFNDYISLNPLFKTVAEFIQAHDLSTLPEGKHIIQGDDLFVNVTTAKGKTPAEARLETHDRMLDIQIPLSTAETMGYIPRTKLEPQPYNADNDITFYDQASSQYLTVEPGMFAIFFPSDGHAPCISKEAEIKKIIFKVKA